MEAPTLYPTLRYTDAPAAIDFLERAFGFRRLNVYENPDGTIAHAELAFGPCILMLGSDRDDALRGRKAGQGWMYVAVDDADAACERARAAGAEIVAELERHRVRVARFHRAGPGGQRVELRDVPAGTGHGGGVVRGGGP